MVIQDLQRALEQAANEESEDSDTDSEDEDEEAEYEAWRQRELSRIQREKDRVEQEEKEQRDIERRRRMTDQEIKQEDEKLRKLNGEDEPKKKYKFLQKYYHRGAFFQDQDLDIYHRRDYSEATGEDLMDKSMLPSVMQVKNFGRSSRTKYTHLVDQDTTDWSSGWAGKGPGDAYNYAAYNNSTTGPSSFPPGTASFGRGRGAPPPPPPPSSSSSSSSSSTSSKLPAKRNADGSVRSNCLRGNEGMKRVTKNVTVNGTLVCNL